VSGLPPYHPQGDYVTFAIPTSRGKRRGLWRRATAEEIVPLYNRAAAQFQYSPVLDESIAQQLHCYRADDNVAILWDQRAFKQIVARRYRAPKLIPFYNAYARVARRIPLPREGGALNQTFIAFLSMEPDYTLLQDLLSHCETPVASVGVHANHPLIPILERFKPIRYPARIYAVQCRTGSPTRPGGLENPPYISTLPAQPEAALL